MPDITVRPAEERDEDGLHTVWSLTYNNGDPFPPERRRRTSDGAQDYVAELDGKISAACNVLDLTATRGQAVIRCGGIGAVAVLPEMRRSGVGSALMSWLAAHFRESEVPMASLYAFREPFYRRFGYEVVGKRLKIVCPSTRWPKVKSRLPSRRLTPSDWQELAPCYEAFSRRRSGMNLRTHAQWQRVLGENRPLTIYAVGDPVEGYAVVSHVSNFWTTDHISEFIWSTAQGYEGVLSILEGLAINKTALSWFEPSDGPFYVDFLDQGVEVSVERPIMFRVNDVPKCLGQLTPDPDTRGEFSIEVADSVVQGNRGPWAVQVRDGKVEVNETSLQADFEVDIRHFAQAFLGEPSLAQLAACGRVNVRSEKGYLAGCLLLHAQPTYCMDFF